MSWWVQHGKQKEIREIWIKNVLSILYECHAVD